jgi:hypothetical protein
LSLPRVLSRKLQTLGRLTAAERNLAAAAMALTACTRVALWTLPFRWIRHFVETQRPRGRARGSYSAARVAWAVRLASRYVPRASCLTQALTAQMLLHWAGLEGQLHIGVARGATFEAHAWIELGGQVLLGGAGESARFSPILSFNRR